MPELALTEQVIELGRRLINQEQDEYPELDRDKTMPVEHRNHVRQECPKWMVLDKPEPDPVFEQRATSTTVQLGQRETGVDCIRNRSWPVCDADQWHRDSARSNFQKRAGLDCYLQQ